jgi:hypothetical protein
MKYLFSLTILLFSLSLFAQKPCEYSVNVTDSLGTYKSTKEYLISEKVFAGSAKYIFFSLAVTDGLPVLNVQFIQKSKEFMKATCFDKNSKLYLQLSNGKIITLLHIDSENCGTMIRDEKGYDNRVTTGTFMFMKDTYLELKNAPISLMRIQYTTETEDYILKKEFKSELNNQVYEPENYFVYYLKCIE